MLIGSQTISVIKTPRLCAYRLLDYVLIGSQTILVIKTPRLCAYRLTDYFSDKGS